MKNQAVNVRPSTSVSKPFISRPKSADSQIQSKKNPTECELNSEYIPPICDNEHLTGECFCHLCTCGKHICPSEYKRKIISSRSHFNTNYRQTYKKHTSKVLIQKPPPEFRPVHFPLESTTTKQKDYTQYEITKTENYSPLKNSLKSQKFIGKTIYSSNFNTWNESFLDKNCVVDHSYIRTETKFDGNSCYREDFRNHSLKNINENKNIAKQLKEQARGVKLLISPSLEFIGKSSQKADYKQIDPEKPIKEKGTLSSFSMGDWRGQFRSTYKDSYSNPLIIRAVKKKYIKLKHS
jgi:hypothetical protein